MSTRNFNLHIASEEEKLNQEIEVQDEKRLAGSDQHCSRTNSMEYIKIRLFFHWFIDKRDPWIFAEREWKHLVKHK